MNLASEQRVAKSLTWRLTTSERVGLGLAAAALWSLLITASLLEPSASGMGTHRQLGLPPCSSVMMFGLRCPACGMTTSWAHFMNGSFVMSARANFGGMLLAIAAIFSSFVLPVLTIRGRSTQGGWYSKSIAAFLIVAVLIAVIEWLIRLL